VPGATDLAQALPKAELHVHIEGTLEPELMFALAERNGVGLKYPDVESVRAAYEFGNLQDFLDIYYAACDVLRTREDFRELTIAYLDRAAADNVRHVEAFCDPQTHTSRGVAMDDVLGGISDGLVDGSERLGISSHLIVCFLRHLSSAEAMRTLEEALPFGDLWIGVGLDSSERDHPPSGFADVYDRAGRLGKRKVGHAGEEGPPEYVWEGLELGWERIDHGNASVRDPELVERLRTDRIPLTMCPLSNLRLKVVREIREHPLPELLRQGVVVTVNSDDPAYFGGYIGANFAVLGQDGMGLSDEEIVQVARNGFEASFLPPEAKQRHLAALDETAARLLSA
jgi:adenosine deaminase